MQNTFHDQCLLLVCVSVPESGGGDIILLAAATRQWRKQKATASDQPQHGQGDSRPHRATKRGWGRFFVSLNPEPA